MEAGKQRRLADVFITITDPRQAAKVEHDLVELLVVAVNAVLVLGAESLFFLDYFACRKLDVDTAAAAFSRSPSGCRR